MTCRPRYKQSPEKWDFAPAILHISHRLAQCRGNRSLITNTLAGPPAAPEAASPALGAHPHLSLVLGGFAVGYRLGSLDLSPAHCCVLLFSKKGCREATARFLPTPRGAHWSISGSIQFEQNILKFWESSAEGGAKGPVVL